MFGDDTISRSSPLDSLSSLSEPPGEAPAPGHGVEDAWLCIMSRSRWVEVGSVRSLAVFRLPPRVPAVWEAEAAPVATGVPAG